MDDYSTSMLHGFGDEVIVCVVLIGAALYAASALLSKWLTPAGMDNRATSSEEVAGRTRSSEHTCSICFDDARLAVETNCGHVFCGSDMFQLYDLQDSGPLSAPRCPYCRQRVTLLLPYFSREERDAASIEEIESRTGIVNRIRDFNRRFSGEPRSFMEKINDLPMMIRNLWRMLWSGEGINMFFRVRMYFLLVACLLYILLPLDIIPEGVFGFIGFLDDILITLLILISLSTLFRTAIAEGGLLA